ncbi:methyl-accepting chemotaxis protein [Methylobacterium organophilum]|uniref:methyl-accepting chemotaxis protein n=1 Tax=Methylobacterium organophilum TaxID=410 RepID=UPI001F145EC2|nr:CHASE3 domain-containing protein [Methylobacterium organophilum]UMY17197.1 methyl-accepting chemotaxis protein [Methylobacterium organophilum]
MPRYSDLPIFVKVSGALAVLALVSVLTSGLSWSNLNRIEATAEATAHSHAVMADAQRLVEAMVNQETGVRGYLIAGEDAFLAPYRGGRETFETTFAHLQGLIADNPGQQKRLTALGEAASRWRKDVAEREIALMRDPETREQGRAIEASGAGKSAMDALRAQAAEIVSIEKGLLDERAGAAAAAGDAFRRVCIGGLLAMILASVATLALLHAGLVKPIRAMTGSMGRLAQGDATVAVPGLGRRDEVGGMAGAVQVFKENLIRTRALEAETAEARLAAEEQRKTGMRQMADAFERAVGGIVETVAAAATEMRATAEGMTTLATRSVGETNAVAGAAQEASNHVGAVAAAAEELGVSVQEIARRVGDSAEMAQGAVNEASATAGLVQELSEAAARIGDVVGMISQIASQTNLLALNATIEAARAGEAGRGFAVVAAEVKELASQTARATDEISGQIARIQGSTQQAVAAIQGIGGRIREINEVASSIAAAVEEQGTATQEIVRSVAEAAQGTGAVTGRIAGVAEAAEETGNAASQVLTSAGELSQQSEHLGSEVARFLATVRAA